MFDALASTRTAVEGLAREFEPRTLTGAQAVRALTELGAIRRLVDAMIGMAAQQVEATKAHLHSGTSDRDAAQLVARVVGTDASDARRAINTAKKLEQLPETAAAVRTGQLSARQAELVADAATANPGAERSLLAAARGGMVPLKDACVTARAHAEDEAKRAARQHAARRFRIWTAADGMVEGHFRLAPEVGGRFKAAIDAGTQRIFRARRTTGPHEGLDAYAAEVLADLVATDVVAGAGSGGSGSKGSRNTVVTNVHVLIEHTALKRGNALEGETCEIPGVGPVNVAWVREMLGHAFVTAVVKKGRDITTVAHFGRNIPAHLRTAMIVGGRECVVAGCHAQGYLEIDHSEVDFAAGGPAAWWNLEYGCAVHHRRKTRGWTLGPRDPKTGKRTLTAPALDVPSAVSRR